MNNVATHKTGNFTEKVLLITQQGNEVTGWCDAADLEGEATVRWSERPFKRSGSKGSVAVFGEVVPVADVVAPAASDPVVPVAPPADT